MGQSTASVESLLVLVPSMTFVENDQSQYVFFLIQKLQVQAQTFYAAGCSLGWQRAGAHGRADATRRRPICNFPLYGARHATVCSKPASAEASAASKTSTLELRRPSARGGGGRRGCDCCGLFGANDADGREIFREIL